MGLKLNIKNFFRRIYEWFRYDSKFLHVFIPKDGTTTVTLPRAVSPGQTLLISGAITHHTGAVGIPPVLTGAQQSVISPWTTHVIGAGGGAGTTLIPAQANQGAVGGAQFPFNSQKQSIQGSLHGNGTSVLTLFGKNNVELCRLLNNGDVIWANDLNIDEAADAFAQTLHLGLEQAVNITKGVKMKMRDTVFEELIKIAEKKGPLSAEELTYLLESSKIVEKLKGGRVE